MIYSMKHGNKFRFLIFLPHMKHKMNNTEKKLLFFGLQVDFLGVTEVTSANSVVNISKAETVRDLNGIKTGLSLVSLYLRHTVLRKTSLGCRVKRNFAYPIGCFLD